LRIQNNTQDYYRLQTTDYRMSSGFYPREFYDMAEVYEDILIEITRLQRRLPYLKCEHFCLSYRCPCHDGGRIEDEDYWDHEQVVRLIREHAVEELEATKSKIKELEELRKIMFDNGERRKLALLALVMKRRK